MAWDTEGTKRRIREAATAEFAQFGPDGTTIERIARAAGVNKERVYNYFGGKKALFAAVLREEMAKVAESVPVESFAEEDIGDYAGRVYDYHRQRPELTRLLSWEALVFEGEVPEEELRWERYAVKSAAVAAGQEAGTITDGIDAAHLTVLVLAIAGWWSTTPQVARMLCGPPDEEEHRRRRTAVVEAARRLADPARGPDDGVGARQ